MVIVKSNLVYLLLTLSLLCFACSARSVNNNAQADKDRTEIESTLARKYSRVGFVNDFANVLTPEDTEELSASANDLLTTKEVDAVIVTINSLEGEQIEKVSMWLGRAWKVGAGKKGDGIVLCLAIAERQSRIDVTRSLESVLTNEECSRILKQTRGWFTEGQYGRGCEEVIRSVREVLNTQGRDRGASSYD